MQILLALRCVFFFASFVSVEHIYGNNGDVRVGVLSWKWCRFFVKYCRKIMKIDSFSPLQKYRSSFKNTSTYFYFVSVCCLLTFKRQWRRSLSYIFQTPLKIIVRHERKSKRLHLRPNANRFVISNKRNTFVCHRYRMANAVCVY